MSEILGDGLQFCWKCGRRRPSPCPEQHEGDDIEREGRPAQIRMEGPDGPYWADPPRPGLAPDAFESVKKQLYAALRPLMREQQVQTVAAMASRLYAAQVAELHYWAKNSPRVLEETKALAVEEAIDLWNRVNDGIPKGGDDGEAEAEGE
jgi:hypothetical protein